MQDAFCQECHATHDFEIADQITGEPLDLFVDDDLYRRSSHAKVGCRHCHSRGYHKIPHSHSGYYPRFMCVDCHDDDDVGEQFKLTERKRELLASVHGKALGTPIDCHVCHDPHEFRPVREIADALPRTEASNAPCMSCHGSKQKRPVAHLRLPDSTTTHERFPNARAHFRKVKCVTCHVGDREGAWHDILPATEAVSDCTACHARDSELLSLNYRRPQLLGASDDAVSRNAYVVGSTRSVLLDRLSQLGFAFIVLLVVVHGGARALHGRRRGGS